MTPEDKLWYMLIGAMLASKEVREHAGRKLLAKDCQEDLRPLFYALKGEDTASVWTLLSGFGVTRDGKEPATTSLITALERAGLRTYCRYAIDIVRNATPLTPDQLVERLEQMAANIRGRQHSIGEQPESR